MIRHPDISHHHPIYDKNAFYSQVDFLITKATEGTGMTDNTMEGIVRECEKRHIPYFLYSFLHRGEELSDAKFLVKTCQKVVGKYFRGYVLDVEEDPLTGTKPTADGTKKALDYIKTKSSKTMIYTSYYDYDRYKYVIAGRGSSCAWWEARYGLNNGHDTSAKYPCHKGVDLHQYTSKGRMAGISGDIDLNKRTGTKSLAWFTGKTEKKKATPKKKYTGKLPDGADCIKKGVIGAEVGYWQKFLVYRGYKLKVDGIFGSKTEEATKTFQKNHKLTADGIVGPKTVAAAKKYM